jgi:DtxR family Mn-dependent transcriptional regulator
MEKDNLTQAVEDYLKTIFELIAVHGRASTTQIADMLGVKPASVTGMIQKLAATEPPLVAYEKHRGVMLTPQGERAALEVIRHHRLLERFLYEVLGFSWEKVHEEAHRLEHVISEEFEERMAEVLGDPTHDPHGDPIPDRDLTMPVFATLCMGDLRSSQAAIVMRVPDEDPELLCYLAKVGVIPEARFIVVAYSSFDENLKILVDGEQEPVVLGKGITARIFVELIR